MYCATEEPLYKPPRFLIFCSLLNSQRDEFQRKLPLIHVDPDIHWTNGLRKMELNLENRTML